MSKCSKGQRRPINDFLNAEDDFARSCTPKSKPTGQWSKEEDDAVIRYVGCNGPQLWSLMASNIPGRAKSGKQCRERWYNQLDPNIKKDGWTDEEDLVIIKAHSEVASSFVL
jgi:myb proto-oncogene protein